MNIRAHSHSSYSHDILSNGRTDGRTQSMMTISGRFPFFRIRIASLLLFNTSALRFLYGMSCECAKMTIASNLSSFVFAAMGTLHYIQMEPLKKFCSHQNVTLASWTSRRPCRDTCAAQKRHQLSPITHYISFEKNAGSLSFASPTSFPFIDIQLFFRFPSLPVLG